MAVKISTGLPNCREGRQNLIGSVTRHTIERTARVAEECGYYSLWPNEFVASQPPVAAKYNDPPTLFDPIVTMSYALAATERIRITPSTIVLPFHEPLILSRQIASLDVFSGGRVTLGVGLGGGADEFRRLREDLGKPNRGRMMDEYIEAMQVLWTERYATYQGRYVKFTDVETHPKPIQNPLPIFLAGHSDGAFRRLARFGHGWIDSNLLPDDLKAGIDKLSSVAAETGRGDVEFEVARQFYVAIAPTEDEAKAIHAAAVPPGDRQAGGSVAGGSGMTEERFMVGTPEQIGTRLADYVAAGATEICVIFYSANDDVVESQLRLFADQVMGSL